MFQIHIDGLGNLNTYLNGIKRKVKLERDILPKRLAHKTKQMVKLSINSGRKMYGAYHKATGTGLAESLQVRKVADGLYNMGPDPNLPTISLANSGVKGGKGYILPPAQYAIMVEEGTNAHPIPIGNGRFVQHPGSRPKRYFAKGFRNAVQDINAELNRSANKIIK